MGASLARVSVFRVQRRRKEEWRRRRRPPPVTINSVRVEDMRVNHMEVADDELEAAATECIEEYNARDHNTPTLSSAQRSASASSRHSAGRPPGPGPGSGVGGLPWVPPLHTNTVTEPARCARCGGIIEPLDTDDPLDVGRLKDSMGDRLRGSADLPGCSCQTEVGGSVELPNGGQNENVMTWKRGELIGHGAYGQVYAGLNVNTGQLIAVKQVPLLSGSSTATKVVIALETEIRMLRRLSHPNIVRYLATRRTESHLLIFLEYVAGGSISALLKRFGPFNEALARRYTKNILRGLKYLHNNSVVHRDIKGGNILVTLNGHCKLADFGAAAHLEDLSTSSGIHSLRGTPYWMAPEVIQQVGHDSKADVWSVGCTLIEMGTGHPPWHEFTSQISALFHIANTNELPQLPERYSPIAKDFIRQCLQRDPRKRPTVAQLLKHPFITGDYIEHAKRMPRRSVSTSALVVAEHGAGGGGGSDEVRTQEVGGAADSLPGLVFERATAAGPSFDRRSAFARSASETAVLTKTHALSADVDEDSLRQARRYTTLLKKRFAGGPGRRPHTLPPSHSSSSGMAAPSSCSSSGSSPARTPQGRIPSTAATMRGGGGGTSKARSRERQRRRQSREEQWQFPPQHPRGTRFQQVQVRSAPHAPTAVGAGAGGGGGGGDAKPQPLVLSDLAGSSQGPELEVAQDIAAKGNGRDEHVGFDAGPEVAEQEVSDANAPLWASGPGAPRLLRSSSQVTEPVDAVEAPS